MPGCLGLDAMWQLVGFFPGLAGQSRPRPRPGLRRSQIQRPDTASATKVVYNIQYTDVSSSANWSWALPTALSRSMAARSISATDLRVGLFKSRSLFRSYEQTSSNHRHGHCFLPGQRCRHRVAGPFTRAARASASDQEQIDVGMRSHVAGAPDIDIARADRPQAIALHGRRRSLRLHRHAAGH